MSLECDWYRTSCSSSLHFCLWYGASDDHSYYVSSDNLFLVARDKINDNVESCKVFITSVPYVEKPVAGLIRVTHPIYGNTEVPIRYVLVIVGKDSVDKEYCFFLLFLWVVITISVVPSLWWWLRDGSTAMPRRLPASTVSSRYDFLAAF